MAAISEPDFQQMDVPRGMAGHATAHDNDFVSEDQVVARLQLLWARRQFLFRCAVWGLVAFTAIAFLIPRRYRSTSLLMPPDDQSSSGLAVAASLAGKMGGTIGGLAGGLLGVEKFGGRFSRILWGRKVHG